ncbi:MAG: type II toxin-antitoxin system HicA family toxin [Verrucomicrobia bacterium]|nr:type II toxin-antitoxin system HicA family toxin [Verrucomicrobiota bacterium]
MPRLGSFSGREVCRILQQHGFANVRQRGSHVIMQKKIAGPSTITVPVPDHKELRKGTLLSIIRQSQVPRCEFEK